MATHSLAQSLFPPGTPISVYPPNQVDAEKQSDRAPTGSSDVDDISAGADAVAASVVTGVVADDNAIGWTAQDAGAAGNGITVALVNNGISQDLSVDVAGDAITVSLETDGASAVTSTAADVETAIGDHAASDALVAVTDSSTSDGTGVVVEEPATNLGSGADAVGTDQALIEDDGTLTVDVTAGADYYAVGQVGNVYRYLRFNVDAP